MALVLYAATTAVVLVLAHRLVRPISRGAMIVLFVLPLGLTGKALITDGVYGPIDYLYQDEPFRSLHPEFGAAAPRNASATDVFSQFYPWRHAVRQSYARGEWPLWNAHNLCGHPMAAEAQAAVYSPFTWIALLLPAAVSLSYSVAIALFLAALSAYLFARELECSEGAALIAGIGWGLASSVVLYAHTAMGCATVFLPLILAATRRVVHEPGFASGGALMTALALCLLAGHPESLFLNVIVGAAYALFELIHHRIRPWRPLVTAIAAGVVTAALCAIYLLPVLEAIPQSVEVAVKTYQSERSQGFTGVRPLAALARDFFPYLHVRAWSKPGIGLIGAETSAAGSILLALAIYAIARRRSAETMFFAMTALFCIAAGIRWKPVSDLLSHIPLLHITHHDRLAFAGALCIVILAAFGADEMLRRDDRRRAGVVFAIVFAALAIGTLLLTRTVTLYPVTGGYGKFKIFAELFFLAIATVLLLMPRRATWLVAALIALVAGQRLLSESDTFSTYSAELAWPKLALLEPLANIREPFRIVGRATAFPPSTNTFYGLQDVRGYEALTLFQFVQTFQLWNRPRGIWYQRVDELANPFLSFLNVRFSIQSATDDVPAGWRVVKQDRNSALIENTQAIERVFVPRQVFTGKVTTEEVVDRMSSLEDFRAYAWIAAPGDTVERQNGPGTIALRSYSPGGEYVFDADMQGDGWAVISDSSWLGWRAYVDGHRVRMSRANGAFLSVHVPPGKHRVRVVYLPASFVRGRAITFATMIVIATVILLRRHRRIRG